MTGAHRWIFDAYDTYPWMYVASVALGVGAAAVVLAFPPAATGTGSAGDARLKPPAVTERLSSSCGKRRG